MRWIKKRRAEPQALKDWKKVNQITPHNVRYSSLTNIEMQAIKQQLLEEQGYLCAYTMRRLSSIESCHIEHVLAQNTHTHLDIDYQNMVACFPANGGDVSHGYGAPIKGGACVQWPNSPNCLPKAICCSQSVMQKVNFISPHSTTCENRFVFNAKGVMAANDNDAIETIELLKLDHEALTTLRRSAIEAHGLTIKSKNPKSAIEARNFANEVLQFDKQGRLEPFCTALAQVALEYARREEARSEGIRRSRQSMKK